MTDKSSVLKGLRGCDGLIHLASSFVFWHPDNRVFRDVNVTGARNVLEGALETGISKVVYVSTAAVYGNAEKPTTEETPVGTERASKYVRTKYEGDLIAWDLCHKNKLPLVVIYPSAVIGANDPKAAGLEAANVDDRNDLLSIDGNIQSDPQTSLTGFVR